MRYPTFKFKNYSYEKANGWVSAYLPGYQLL